jgi:hypothetical protein
MQLRSALCRRAHRQQLQRLVVLLQAVEAVGLLRAQEVVLDGQIQRLVELRGTQRVRIPRACVSKSKSTRTFSRRMSATHLTLTASTSSGNLERTAPHTYWSDLSYEPSPVLHPLTLVADVHGARVVLALEGGVELREARGHRSVGGDGSRHFGLLPLLLCGVLKQWCGVHM